MLKVTTKYFSNNLLDTKLSETELNSILTDCVPRILFTSLSNQNVADKLKSTVVSIEQVMPILAFQFLFSIGDATLKVWPVNDLISVLPGFVREKRYRQFSVESA